MKNLLTILLCLVLLNSYSQKLSYTDSILITLKNGVTVSATICKNDSIKTPQPVIFVYNIYSLSKTNKIYITKAAEKGYIGVIVNTRGKMLSRQEIEPFEHDAEDAYEIIDWISKQSWCNGKIGMYGGSYLGFSQWACLKKLHPALKTIVPQAAVGVGIDFPMQNNIFYNYMLNWIHFVTNNKTTDLQDFLNYKHWDSVYKAWYVSGRSYRALDSIEGRPNKIFQRWLNHPSYDNYWKNMTPQQQEFANINIPILTITGYFDADQIGALHYYKEHIRFNKNADHYLVIGPYTHAGVQSLTTTPSQVGDYKVDSVSIIKIFDLIFDWFNYTLKDSAKPAFLQDKVNYEIMDANKWEHKNSLKDASNDTLKLFLSSNKILSKNISNKNSFSYTTVNFADRSDTSNKSEKYSDTMIFDNNTLVFKSEELKQDLEINGTIAGTLNSIINKKDVDLVIQLFELTQAGKYIPISATILRASYANNSSNRKLLQSNKMENICINNSYFISKLVKKSSKFVCAVSINKNYGCQINYGTGKDVSDENISDAKEPIKLKLYSDSFIKVPMYK